MSSTHIRTITTDDKSDNYLGLTVRIFVLQNTRIKGYIQTGYCSRNHAIKAILVWKPIDIYQVKDLARSKDRMIEFQTDNY